jgi:hypothetical protein
LKNTEKIRVLRSRLAYAVFLILNACSLMGGAEKINHADDYDLGRPETWNKISKKDSDHAYSLPSGAIVIVNSSCDHRSGAPLDVLSNQLLIGSRKRKMEPRRDEKIGEHTGAWTAGRVEMEGVPIYLNLFVTKNEDCVFDFSLMRRNAITASDTAEFKKFIATLKYGKD